MKRIFEKIWELAEPYLDTRDNTIHTRISVRLAYQLLDREGGDPAIVIPAIILHDVGWKAIPENLHLAAFGPKATSPELNRVHEVEGVRIAKEILEQVQYDHGRIEEILEIIDGHDSREEPLSLNDKLVKDADRLSRYAKEIFHIDMQRYNHTYEEELNRIRSQLEKWFFTRSAKRIARKELRNRLEEFTDTQS
ncbi:MAG: HD domain-containing protein [Deltaproteobacteria bacterium]|nr:MAG: HD domain-containing protein [Deltaproteobacteria bacterium]